MKRLVWVLVAVLVALPWPGSARIRIIGGGSVTAPIVVTTDHLLSDPGAILNTDASDRLLAG